MTNKEEFKIAMIRAGVTAAELADAVDMSAASLSYKVNNKREFSASEIKAISDALRLTPEERDVIFFADTVDGKST